MRQIQKVAVIGAGVMGSGIAAHMANAGLEVVLLDLDAGFAAGAVEKQVKTGGFMAAGLAGKVSTGSTRDHMALLADADWVVEAVAERLDIKQGLYRQIDAVRKPGSIVSSNTSTIPLKALVDGMPEAFARDFMITHFFNPPRRMRLLEVVSGPATNAAALASITGFADVALGKSVVRAKDTPGFIGNCIGVYWLLASVHEAIALGIDVEEADAILGKPFGIPSTGVFGLMDLVGIDLMASILASFQASLPPGDAMLEYAEMPPLIAGMIAAGRIGRKGGAGFYRVSADRKTREVIDLATGEYRPQRAVASESLEAAGNDLRALVAHPGLGGRFAAAAMGRTLAYAAERAPDIAESPAAVDEAMRLGYAWTQGPFELIDRLGGEWLRGQITARSRAAPPLLDEAIAGGGFYATQDGVRGCLTPGAGFRPIARQDGVFSLADHKLTAEPVESTPDASLWDIGDGVGLIELHTKLGTLSPGALAALDMFVDVGARRFKALVIGSDAPYFSAGADLRVFIEVAEKSPDGLANYLRQGQEVLRKIKHSPIPVVAAASGAAVGGGCELLMHCAAVQAHAELNAGLVETSIGLIPGWGGCKELLLRLSEAGSGRARGPVAPASAAFDLIGPGRVSTSAYDARALGFLRARDGITMNSDRLLADAKALALRIADGYQPPEPGLLCLAGPSGALALKAGLHAAALAGRATPHDCVVGEALIGVLTGGPEADPARPVSEDAVMEQETAAFLALYATPATQARVQHMLAARKPLRN
jgi:3-hydroxyacyl-CoA dehydrogenase